MVNKDLKDAAKSNWMFGGGGILGGFLVNKLAKKIGLNDWIKKKEKENKKEWGKVKKKHNLK